jgi:prolyl-tRNA editing enzyme YbaK/EbsC (Cys-tRNA(Pro) deacylase)
MSDLDARIRAAMAATGEPFEIIPCDPELADTAVFCSQYGYAPEESANTILVRSKTGETRFVACVVLATTRLDVNKRVRKLMGVRKVSFAGPEETRDLTGMEPGGVTPPALPPDVALWIDSRVMACGRVILGGGGRESKIITTPGMLAKLPGAEVVEGLALDLVGQEGP